MSKLKTDQWNWLGGRNTLRLNKISIICLWPLRWRHNDHAGVSNHQPPGCLLNRLFRRKSKKTSKLRVTGLCAGNSPGTGEFSAQMASYAENVSIWWRHHDLAEMFPSSSSPAHVQYLQLNITWWCSDCRRHTDGCVLFRMFSTKLFQSYFNAWQ